jgi:hypothetical protein
MWASRDSLTAYLQKRNHALRPEFYAPCDNVTVLLRLVEYIIYACEQENNPPQAAVYRSFRALFGNRTTYFMED